jgi:hypothetical protein
MSAAALTPRVRIFVVCDEALPSKIEEGVFTLEGVRYQVSARSFPCLCSLSVYLLLSYPRMGRFQGRIRVVDEEEDKTLRHRKFVAEFDQDAQPVPLAVDLGECAFPAPKVYTIKVEFASPTGEDILKGEMSFPVLELED